MNQKRLVDELIEDRETDQKIVMSFRPKETLSLDIFGKQGETYVMNEGVRNSLLKISDTFIDFMDVELFVYDVILTGSLSNFNWSEYSDVDLHILVNMDEFDGEHKSYHDIIKKFLDSKKNVWNLEHNIKIKGYEVELYVQDITEKHVSSGVYSILNNKWIVEPSNSKNDIDDSLILEKGEEYANIIDDLKKEAESGKDVTSEIDDVKSKLKRFRQSGLESGGEYSYENLTFKLLRRNGYIEKLLGIKKDIGDKKLSMAEQ
jgi:hypothetical protein